jgi:Spy/CpxP family protein refolding chaperone
MKKILASMLAVVIAFSAVAQEENKNAKGKRGDDMSQRRGPEQVKRQGMIGGVGSLNLTDAQKQQMKQVNEDFRQQMQDLNKNESITVKEQKEKRAALVQQHKTNVQNILTPEQRKELEEKKKSYKDKGAKGNHAKGDDRGDDFRQLNLTDAQGVKIKAVNEEFRTKVQAIQKNASLSAEQKKVQREAAQQQHTAAIKAILTQEQTAKLEELKRTRPERRGKK